MSLQLLMKFIFISRDTHGSEKNSNFDVPFHSVIEVFFRQQTHPLYLHVFDFEKKVLCIKSEENSKIHRRVYVITTQIQ